MKNRMPEEPGFYICIERCTQTCIKTYWDGEAWYIRVELKHPDDFYTCIGKDDNRKSRC